MEIFNIYLTHSLQLLNGVTAFSVLQALTFIYWSQSDDFKDCVKFGGHIGALVGIAIFAILYCAAIYLITESQIGLLDKLTSPANFGPMLKPTFDPCYLKDEATTSRNYRLAVVVIFHFLSAVALWRYFVGEYTAPKDRVAVR